MKKAKSKHYEFSHYALEDLSKIFPHSIMEELYSSFDELLHQNDLTVKPDEDSAYSYQFEFENETYQLLFVSEKGGVFTFMLFVYRNNQKYIRWVNTISPKTENFDFD